LFALLKCCCSARYAPKPSPLPPRLKEMTLHVTKRFRQWIIQRNQMLQAEAEKDNNNTSESEQKEEKSKENPFEALVREIISKCLLLLRFKPPTQLRSSATTFSSTVPQPLKRANSGLENELTSSRKGLTSSTGVKSNLRKSGGISMSKNPLTRSGGISSTSTPNVNRYVSCV
jgi:hypothetical protein